MLASEIQEFHDEFFQDVLAAADADGRYTEDAFFDLFCERLVEIGEMDTSDRAPYTQPRGMRIDGYGGDPLTTGGVLTLIVADFNQEAKVSTLTRTDMNAIFKRGLNFLMKIGDEAFRNSLDESLPAFGLADLIAKRWPSIAKVKFVLISNRVLSTRVDGRKAGELEGVPVTYSVWDLGRLYRLITSEQGQEEIVIDLTEYGGVLPVLPAHLDDAGYEAYLGVVPGEQLAAIYDRWGARLLEQNVRVFLQARGNVNRGIRATIENSPEMFFAYNNGITATATAIESQSSGSGVSISRLINLQIVNGGQTTASIHAASQKKDIDLSRVFVQMKLSIVDKKLAEDIVPKISEYANSQNRVNAADFFANHPFHVRMQDFSRRLYAPATDGAFRESKWFYERARGQYQDERGRLTDAQRKRFDLEYPKKQLFTKTDLAKYLNVWRGQPHIVSRGAQKNFAEFARYIGEEWDRHSDRFNESFYREAIAKAIIFREVERLVTAQPWYEGGYRANVVAFAIAKLGHDIDLRNDSAINFERVWRAQGVSDHFKDALVASATAVHQAIVTPPHGSSNVTEWAKQPACWSRVSALQVPWPDRWLDELITGDEQRMAERSAVRDQKILNGIEAQTLIFSAGGDVWRSVLEWGIDRKLLSPKEEGILRVAAGVPHKIPSDKQSLVVIATLRKLHEEGCPIGRELI